MQRDFHYYCVAVLARAAGFTSQDALTIAYASQYVDNATESEGIAIKVSGGEVKFDPVRTAYDLRKPAQGLKSLDWSSQKRIFIPFHFIPPKLFDPTKGGTFSFVTEANSSFA